MNKLSGIFYKIFISVLISLCCMIPVSEAFARNYSAKDINGHSIHFSIPSSKWVVINFWATWCGACVEEIPEMNKLASTLANKAVFFAVDFEGLPANELRAFASHYGMNYPVTRFNPVSNLINQESFTSIPVTVVISPQGNVNVLHGEQSVNDILQAMA